MNKRELIDTVAEHTDISRATVTQVLGGVLEAIQLAVAAGDKVSITGFGSFEATHRPGRFGRNPQTGEPLEIAESWGPKFRPGAEFKAAVATSRQGIPSMTPPCPL